MKNEGHKRLSMSGYLIRGGVALSAALLSGCGDSGFQGGDVDVIPTSATPHAPVVPQGQRTSDPNACMDQVQMNEQFASLLMQPGTSRSVENKDGTSYTLYSCPSPRSNRGYLSPQQDCSTQIAPATGTICRIN